MTTIHGKEPRVPENTNLELADTIRAIRGELTLAMEQGGDEDLRFRLGPVEIELAVQVTAKEGFKGGIKVLVLSVGSDHSSTDVETHRLKLTLHPQDAHGQDAVISDEQGSKPVE